MTREATPVGSGNVTCAAGHPARRHGQRGTAGHPASVAGAPARDGFAALAAAENFPVALRVLPATQRRRLMAVYRFARLVDDIGDEPAPRGVPGPGAAADRASGQAPGPGPADRLAALDAVERELDLAFANPGTARSPVIGELAAVAAECAIPAALPRLLVEANRRDQTVRTYATFDDLLGYCRLSADPVGRMVLRVFGAATPARERLSDLVCTALQLAEHWQDVAEDFGRDRVYLPAQDMAAFGCTERDLAAVAGARRAGAGQAGAAQAAGGPGGAPARAVPARLRELMRFEAARAAALLDEGAALTGTLHGWARLAVAGYVAGGRATLAAIAATGDVFSVTPRPGRARTVAGLLRAYLAGR